MRTENKRIKRDKIEIKSEQRVKGAERVVHIWLYVVFNTLQSPALHLQEAISETDVML